MSNIKKSIITAVCLALCVILPMAFHSIPNAGSIFLPMHIPVLLCGLICGWPFGLLCGIGGPLLSSLITQMPPMAYLPQMMIELAIYGLFSGILMSIVRTKKIYVDLYITLISTMLVGRIISGLCRALIFAPGSYSIALWMGGYFATGLPGIIIQLALIPSIIFALEQARLIPRKYRPTAK